MIGKYSIFNMMKEFRENKPIIEAYLKNQSVEGSNDTVNVIAGLSIGMFLTLIMLGIAIWVWAIVVTIKYWNQLPVWAQILAIIGLLTGVGGPIMTLIVVYVGKDQGHVKLSNANFRKKW